MKIMGRGRVSWLRKGGHPLPYSPQTIQSEYFGSIIFITLMYYQCKIRPEAIRSTRTGKKPNDNRFHGHPTESKSGLRTCNTNSQGCDSQQHLYPCSKGHMWVFQVNLGRVSCGPGDNPFKERDFVSFQLLEMSYLCGTRFLRTVTH